MTFRILFIIGLCIALIALFIAIPVGKKNLSQEEYTPMDEER